MRFAGSHLGVDLTGFMSEGPKYDNLTTDSIGNRSKERAVGYDAQAYTETAGFKAQEQLAQARTAAAQIEADATVGAAESQASAISSLGSSIGQGLGGLFGGGGGSSSSSGGTFSQPYSSPVNYSAAPSLDFSNKGSFGATQYNSNYF